jgi:hypothetical protein
VILILSGPGDVHADAVEAVLLARDVAFHRFDTSTYPDEAACSFAIERDGSVTGTLRSKSLEIPLESITSIWVRRPGRPATHAPHLGPEARAQVAADSAAVLDDLWGLLPVRCIPAAPDRIAAAAFKARQLRGAAQLGFDIPYTWTGNSPAALLDLVSDQPSRFVTKRSAPSQRMADERGEEVSRYTNFLRPRDLAHVDGIQLCPLTVQRAITKAVELRVTVVGRQVFTAAIHSQRSNHTRNDWRRFDLAHTPIESYQLQPDVADRCVRLVAGYGLSYGAIDLVVTPDGRLIFLELNPNGQYLWVEHATGQPISAALAEALADGSLDHLSADEALPVSAA